MSFADLENIPISKYITAGIFASVISDSVMHSLDVIKTRQQAGGTGSTNNAVKYNNTLRAYAIIFKEEGLFRGLYSGYWAAMLGSVPRGITFFGTYEYLKKTLIHDYNWNPTLAYLASGFMGDLTTSVLFVPSEVLKTRFQLQGRYNNPYFQCEYNYKNLRDGITSIYLKEGGIKPFYSGYRATLCRDLPFSAIQFALYEEFRKIGLQFEKKYCPTNDNDQLSTSLEILIGGAAGAITGFVTTPLDVFKTRIQTQANEVDIDPHKLNDSRAHHFERKTVLEGPSVNKGIWKIYQNEGLSSLFSGYKPRFMWCGIQSGVMFLVYQKIILLI